MEYRQLKSTDLNVSRLCFGAMTFGKPADQATATRMVDCCIDAGINFFDTANVYQLGVAETMLGIAIRNRRDKLVLASKVHGKMGEGPDESGLSKAAIFRAIDESLRRLQTDHLDIYYLHAPDYRVPIEESMDALETLVRQGKVRHTAISNYASWQACQMHCIAGKRGWQPPSISQVMYNLIARGLEQEFVPMAKSLAVSIIVYNPLAGGLLTGKHNPQTIAPGTRFENKLYQNRYWHAQDFQAVEQLKKIAQDAGRSLISLSLNWLLHHTATDCIILGASRLDQLEQNIRAAGEGPLSPETVQACDAVWQEFRGPAAIYNR